MSSKEAWASDDKPYFVSSFRPFAQCLQCFGFDIDFGDQKSVNCHLISIFYRYTWLLVNMVAVGNFMHTTYGYVTHAAELREKVNFGITYATAAVQVALTYGSLALATWKDRGQLAESLRKIEARMPISKAMVKKVRVTSITAVAVAAILVRAIQTAH